jgi:hypothetical protein
MWHAFVFEDKVDEQLSIGVQSLAMMLTSLLI